MNVIVQTPTPALERSRSYYTALGFRVVSEGPPLLVSDGQVSIRIDPTRTARTGLRLYDSDWALTARELARQHPVVPIDGGYLVGSPGGTWVYLLEGVAPVFPVEAGAAAGLPGRFAGLSIESLDLVRSFAFWEELGFRSAAGAVEKGWLSLRSPDGGFTVSLMRALQCPHLFPNPSLTYFNGTDNPAIIAGLRAGKIPILEEIAVFNPRGEVDNVLLRDPGGLGIFVFND